MPRKLKEEDRIKLDGIVQQMVSNKESDTDIQFVVEDFKNKYGTDELKKKDLSQPLSSTAEDTENAPITESDLAGSQTANEFFKKGFKLAGQKIKAQDLAESQKYDKAEVSKELFEAYKNSPFIPEDTKQKLGDAEAQKIINRKLGLEVDLNATVPEPLSNDILFNFTKKDRDNKLKEFSLTELEEIDGSGKVFGGVEYMQSKTGKANQIIQRIKSGKNVTERDYQYLRENTPKALDDLKIQASTTETINDEFPLGGIVAHFDKSNTEQKVKSNEGRSLGAIQYVEKLGLDANKLATDENYLNEADKKLTEGYELQLQNLEKKYPASVETYGGSMGSYTPAIKRDDKYFTEKREIENQASNIRNNIATASTALYAKNNPSATPEQIGEHFLKIADKDTYTLYEKSLKRDNKTKGDIHEIGYNFLYGTGDPSAVRMAKNDEADHVVNFPERMDEEIAHRFGAELYKKQGGFTFAVQRPTIQQLDQIADTQFPENVREAYYRSFRQKELNNKFGTYVPQSGFANKLFENVATSIEETGKGVGDILQIRGTEEQALDALQGVPVGRQDVGEYEPAKQKLAELNKKSKLTYDEIREKEDLESFVGVRSGFDETMDIIGGVTGQVAEIALGSKGLGALAKGTKLLKTAKALQNTEKVAAGMLSYGMSYDGARRDLLQLKPEATEKELALYGNVIGLSNAFSENIFRDAKVLEAFKKEVTPLAQRVFENLSKEQIEKMSKAEANGMIKEFVTGTLPKFAKEFGKNTGQEVLEEEAVQVVTSVMDGLERPDKFNIKNELDKAWTTATQTAIGGSLVAGLGAFRDVRANRMTIPLLNRVGYDNKLASDVVNLVNSQVADGKITADVGNEQIAVVNALQEIHNTTLKTANQIRPLSKKENEKVAILSLQEKMYESALKKGNGADELIQGKIDEIKKQRNEIFNKEVIVTDDYTLETVDEYNKKLQDKKDLEDKAKKLRENIEVPQKEEAPITEEVKTEIVDKIIKPEEQVTEPTPITEEEKLKYVTDNKQALVTDLTAKQKAQYLKAKKENKAEQFLMDAYADKINSELAPKEEAGVSGMDIVEATATTDTPTAQTAPNITSPLNTEQDASKIESTTKVDVRQQARNGEKVGEGNTKSENTTTESEAQKQTKKVAENVSAIQTSDAVRQKYGDVSADKLQQLIDNGEVTEIEVENGDPLYSLPNEETPTFKDFGKTLIGAKTASIKGKQTNDATAKSLQEQLEKRKTQKQTATPTDESVGIDAPKLAEEFNDHFLNSKGIKKESVPTELINELPEYNKDAKKVYRGVNKTNKGVEGTSWTFDEETARDRFAGEDGKVTSMTFDKFKEKYDFVSMDKLDEHLRDNGIEDKDYISESEIIAYPKSTPTNTAEGEAVADAKTQKSEAVAETPTEKTPLERAKEIINSDIVQGDSATTLKDAVASNDDAKLTRFLSNIADQANDKKTYQPTVKTYGQELVDIAQKLNPIGDKKTNTDTDVQVVPLSSLKTDEKRFQNRDELNQNMVDDIAENWNDKKQDAIHVWKDPKDGNTYVLSGHHRYYAAKQAGIKNVKITDRTNDYTEAEAIVFAKEEANATRTMETALERAKVLRDKIERGDSKEDIQKFLDREGKNARYIQNLAALNPDGKAIEYLKNFSKSEDRATQKETEKLADWIGEAKRTINGITDAHENEMTDFLFDKKVSQRISTKADFLQKVRSVVQPMLPNEPLNLRRFAQKTQGEQAYEDDVNEKKNKIAELTESINETNDRFTTPSRPDYIGTEDADYKAKRKLADDKISNLEKVRERYQKELEDIYRKKGQYTGAPTTGSLFSTSKPKKSITKEAFTALTDMLQKAFPKVEFLTREQAEKILADKGIKVNEMQTASGSIFGFEVNGKIFLDETAMNADTPIHEVIGHYGMNIIDAQAKSGDVRAVSIINKGFDLLKDKEGKAVLEEVQANPAYANLPLRKQKMEALATIIGREGAGIFEAGTKDAKPSKTFQQKVKSFITSFYEYIKAKLPTLKNKTIAQIQKMDNKEFIRAIIGDAFRGEIVSENNENKLSLQKITDYANQILTGKTVFKRFSQDEQRGFTEGGQIHVEATILLAGENSTNSTPNASVEEQESAIEQYAKEKGVWVENINETFDKKYQGRIGAGEEAIVWDNGETVVKSQNTLLYGNLQEKLDGITLMNTQFPETAVKVLGFGRNEDGDFQVIVEQPYVKADPNNKITKPKINEYLEKIGYTYDNENNHSTPNTLIEDIHTGNAILTPGGNIVVIDPIMRLNTPQQGYGGTRVVEETKFDDINFAIAPDKLQQEIQDLKDEGLSDEDIKDILLDAGNTESEIDNILNPKNTENEKTKTEAKTEEKENVLEEPAEEESATTPKRIRKHLKLLMGNMDFADESKEQKLLNKLQQKTAETTSAIEGENVSGDYTPSEISVMQQQADEDVKALKDSIEKQNYGEDWIDTLLDAFEENDNLPLQGKENYRLNPIRVVGVTNNIAGLLSQKRQEPVSQEEALKLAEQRQRLYNYINKVAREASLTLNARRNFRNIFNLAKTVNLDYKILYTALSEPTIKEIERINEEISKPLTDAELNKADVAKPKTEAPTKKAVNKKSNKINPTLRSILQNAKLPDNFKEQMEQLKPKCK